MQCSGTCKRLDGSEWLARRLEHACRVFCILVWCDALAISIYSNIIELNQLNLIVARCRTATYILLVLMGAQSILICTKVHSGH